MKPSWGKVRIGVVAALGAVASAILTFAVLTASHAQLATSVWPMFHHDLKHTGLSTVDTSANPGTLTWKFATAGQVDSSPAVGTDGTIYVGSWDSITNTGNLYAVSPDGKQKSAFTTPCPITNSSPAVGTDGTIYVGSGGGKCEVGVLYAFNPNGTQKWAFTTVIGGAIYSSPAIGADGTIYVGSDGGYLYAVNPDGTQKWTFFAPGGVDSSPAIGTDGTIYVGSDDDNLYAITDNGPYPCTGCTAPSQKWAFAGGGAESSPAIGADGTVYIGGEFGLYALTDGGQGIVTQIWEFITGGNVGSSPAIGADGTIYVGDGEYNPSNANPYASNLYAVNPNGTQKWTFPTGNYVESSPAIGADGMVYVGCEDDNLYALTDGGQGTVTEKWAFPTGGVVYSSPAIGADGTIYVGSDDDNLYAVGIPSPTATATATATATPTATPTASGTPTATATATATPTPVPVKLKIEPRALKFPKTAFGTPSKPKTVKVSNPKGNKKHPGLPVLIEMISGDPGVFTETNTCPASLAADAFCTISVTFTPSAATKQTGTLVITDNANGSPQMMPLSGRGK